MTKDVIEAIEQRRSVRSFTREPVPEATIGRLVEAALDAPSAGNLQPWQLVVVFNEETRRALAGACLHQHFIAEAPVNIVVCLEQGKSQRVYGRRGDFYQHQDVGAAIENMLLAATGYGLGTCWVGAFDEDKVSQILELGGDLRPAAIIAVGYSNEEPRPIPRRNANDVVKIII
ncbi:nitroreductase family protein [Desulfotomaculum nigrificans]|uniref:nitroreductase family protein n=1 Tax=Desulfotomaculum nigrificans TaxID=1565 RepID=UPI0001FAE92C|nr:nitroreductase family protein [Desulfotomaculum nigrificans]